MSLGLIVLNTTDITPKWITVVRSIRKENSLLSIANNSKLGIPINNSIMFTVCNVGGSFSLNCSYSGELSTLEHPKTYI